jgi:hypothetical protein
MRIALGIFSIVFDIWFFGFGVVISYVVAQAMQLEDS